MDVVLKKLAHAAAYAVLAILLNLALTTKPTQRPRFPGPSWIALAIAVAYAVTDEIHQAFVPTRHPSLLDILIDSGGAAAALLLFARLHRSRVGGIRG